MTLFSAVDAGPLYREALQRFFEGGEDALTIGILKKWRTS